VDYPLYLTLYRRHHEPQTTATAGVRSQRRTFIVGNVSHCPLPPETLAALGPDSPYVVQVYGSGLTGEVYRLRIAGKEQFKK
jgi:hypothetical protein